MDIYLRRLLRWQWVGIVILSVTIVFLNARVHMKKVAFLKNEIKLEKEAADSVDKEELARLQRSLEEENAHIAESMKVFEEAAANMRSKVIKEKNVALLTQEIVNIADEYNIELSLVKPLASTEQGNYELMPMSMQFKASYPDFLKFLDAIERSSLLAGVEGFLITANQSMLPLLGIQLTAYTLFSADLQESLEDEGGIAV